MNKYILSAPYILKKTLLTSFNSSSSVKFFSGNSLEKVFAYEYDLDTLYYVYSKYNLSFDFAKKKLDSLVALKHSKAFLDVKNKKIRELCEIKSDLKSKGYLYRDELTYRLLKNSDEVILALKDYSKGLMSYLDENNIKYSLFDYKKVVKKQKVDIYEDSVEELGEVLNEVADLLSNGVNASKIAIVSSEDKFSEISLVAKMFNFSCKYDNIKASELPYVNTFLEESKKAGKFLTEYLLFNNKEQNIISSSLKEVLKELEDKDYVFDFKFDYLLSKINNIKTSTLSGVHLLSSIKDAYSYDHVFILDFSSNSVHRFKENDYLSDEEKEKYTYLETTSNKNNNAKIEMLAYLSLLKDVHISRALIDFEKGEEIFPSSITKTDIVKDDLYLEEVKHVKSKIRYSKSFDELIYNVLVDRNNTYGYSSKYFTYLKKIMNLDKYKIVNKGLNYEVAPFSSYSTSALQSYATCPFAFFLSYIVKISDFTKNLNAIRGNILHKLIENYNNGEDYSFETLIKEYEGEDLNNLDYYFLKRAYDSKDELLNFIDSFKKIASIDRVVSEKKFYFTLESGNVINGKIDAIYYSGSNYYILDYKTSAKNVDLDKVFYGMDMQLVFYSIVQTSLEKNHNLLGLLYLGLLNNTYYKNKKDGYVLKGLLTRDVNYLKTATLNYDEFIKKYAKEESRNKDFSFDEIFSNTTKKIDELIDSIKKGVFDVTRKRSSSASSLSYDSLYSCKYCTYKDLCYCSKEDEVLLESFYKKEEEE